MNQLMLLAARYPWVTLALLTVISIAVSLPLPRLTVDVSSRALLPASGDVKALYDYVKQHYGSEDSTFVVVSSDKLLTEEYLEAVAQTLEALESLPFVSRTQSLFSVPNIRAVDDFIHTEPYLKQIPKSDAQRDELVRSALFNPMVAGSLLSNDASTMAIEVIITGDHEGVWNNDTQVVNGIEQAIAPLRDQFDQVVQIGGPRIRDAIASRIEADQKRIILPAVAMLLIMLGLLMRSFTAAILPLLTAGLSILWILGLMAGMGIPLGVITAIIPALLVIIGSTEDVHLLSEYRSAIVQGSRRGEAISIMGRRMSAAVSLTAATTCVGFLSISLNDLQMLREFGLLAALGLLFNFLITVTLVPAMLAIIGPHRMASISGQSGWVKRFAKSLVVMASRDRNLLLGGTTIVVVILLYGASSLYIHNDTLEFFPDGDQIIKDTQWVEEQLSGTETFSVLVSAGIEDTFLKVRYLEAVNRLQRRIDELPGVDRTLSFANYMAMINTVMMDDASHQLYLPESDDVLREYALFIKPEHVGSFVLNDYSEVRIVVRHHIRSSDELEHVLTKISEIAEDEIEHGLSVSLTGASVLSAHAARGMARGQALSLAFMVVMIFVVVAVLFWNPWAGVVAVVPNVVPIVGLFGVMGFMGIPLDNGTTMVAAIALGICVDDTMHFLVRYHENSKFSAEEFNALENTIGEELPPIVTTSIALALGFAVLSFSSFPPVARFGLLSAMVMLLALASTFLLAPVMLATVKLITLWEVLSLKLRSEVISRCKLFSGLKPNQIKRAVLLSVISKFKSGSYVVQQGDLDKQMYVVLDGTLEVSMAREEGARDLLTQLTPGDVFGEIALVSDSPRTTDIKVVRDTRLLVFDWLGLDRVARRNPVVASFLFRNLSDILAQRLVRSEEQRLLIHDTPTGAYSMSYFRAHLSREMELAQRFSDPLTLMAFDITGGNVVNGDIEAGIGNIGLKLVADAVRQYTRNVDLFARWSDNRFIIMLSRTNIDGAAVIIDKLQKKISDAGDYSLTFALADYHKGEQTEPFLDRVETALEYAILDAGKSYARDCSE